MHNTITDFWLDHWTLSDVVDLHNGATFAVCGVPFKVTESLSDSMSDFYDVENLETGQIEKHVIGPEIRLVLYQFLETTILDTYIQL